MHSHEADDVLLGMFERLGVDFERPRELNFYFSFPTESTADNAMRTLAEKNLSVNKLRVDPPWWKRLFVKPEWTVVVRGEMPLDEPKIKRITTTFQRIASANSGEYDGWEANVMDDQIDAAQF